MGIYDQPTTQADKVIQVGKAQSPNNPLCIFMGTKMTQPKLREGAEELITSWAVEFAKDIDVMRDRGNTYNDFCCGVDWALNNLHKLLEPTSWKGSFVDTPHSGLIFDKREKLEALAELTKGLEEKPSNIKPVAIIELEDE